MVQALLGRRVVQVACGSRDAQTLALTEDGIVYSWYVDIWICDVINVSY